MEEELIAYLSRFVTPRRLERMDAVLAERSRYVSVVLEDIFQPHNASAVLRSCDSCGVQDVHIIEKRNSYRVNPGVELGTAQWLTLRKYRLAGGDAGSEGRTESVARGRGTHGEAGGVHGGVEGAGQELSRREATQAEATRPEATESRLSRSPVQECVANLRSTGYRIVATTPHTDDVELPDFDLSPGKVALCFGTELDGLSDEFLSEADEYLKIPMYGFVESFNISVSAAITLYTLSQALRRTEGLSWRLSETERQEILLGWLRRSIKESGKLEERFWAERADTARGGPGGAAPKGTEEPPGGA